MKASQNRIATFLSFRTWTSLHTSEWNLGAFTHHETVRYKAFKKEGYLHVRIEEKSVYINIHSKKKPKLNRILKIYCTAIQQPNKAAHTHHSRHTGLSYIYGQFQKFASCIYGAGEGLLWGVISEGAWQTVFGGFVASICDIQWSFLFC